MSFNRSYYDTCSHQIQQSNNVSILGHILNKDIHEHTKKCRHQLGWLGGNNVSHITGNLVDLESDLVGITRNISKCCNNAYVPSKDGKIYNDKTTPIDTTPRHQPHCQAIAYQKIPLPQALRPDQKRCWQ
jgi:hypothetical protein